MSFWRRLDADAAAAVRLASEESAAQGVAAITPYSLLLGIAREGTGNGARVLSRFGISLWELRRLCEPVPRGQDAVISGQLPLNSDARRAIARAMRSGRCRGHRTISSSHLLVALLDDIDGQPWKVITQLKTNPAHVKTVACESIGVSTASAALAPVVLSYPASGARAFSGRRSWLRRLLGAKG